MQDTKMQEEVPDRMVMEVDPRYVEQLSEYLSQLKMEDTKTIAQEIVIKTNYKEGCVKQIDNHRIQSNGHWDYLVGFEDGTVEWVPEKYCNCDIKISKYLGSQGIKTLYYVCRVSTKQQAGTNMVSLNAQEKEINKHVSKCGTFDRIKIVKIVASAYKNVPKDIQNISKCLNKGDLIIVYAIDRLSRNIFKYSEFFTNVEEKGANIYSTKENINYRDHKILFWKYVLDAQNESETISRRVKLGQDMRRELGDEYRGQLSYGKKYQRNNDKIRKIVSNEEEQTVIMKILSLYDGYSPQPTLIAKYLNKHGMVKRGKQWNAGMVQRIIKQSLNRPVDAKSKRKWINSVIDI